MQWAREHEFDALIQAVSASFGSRVAPELIKAIIAAESGFNPAAVRGEPQIGDASIGLMQVLYATAQGLGYPGEIGDAVKGTGLFRPDANVYIGTKLLDQLLRQTGGDVDAAISAYNGGYRPTLGFGARRTANTPAVCLRWKKTAPKTGRTIAADCEVQGSTKPGEFSNQDYVSRVKRILDYFFGVTPPTKPAARL